MKDYVESGLRNFLALVVLAGFGLASAGSYEDFFRAVQQDDPVKVKELLVLGFDANTIDSKGQNGLYLALIEPSFKAAQVLIDWPKTDVNKLNANSESALMIAALRGQFDQAEKLIKKGADVNKTGWAPLHYAASSGQISIISLLLDNSAYIDAESPNRTTPLMMAAMYGTPQAVKLLLREGADPSLKNQQGLTALQFAQRGNRPDSVEAIAAVLRGRRPAGQW